MDPKKQLETIAAEPSVVIRKFQLIKALGSALRAAGIDPQPMSAAQIEAELRKLFRAPRG